MEDKRDYSLLYGFLILLLVFIPLFLGIYFFGDIDAKSNDNKFDIELCKSIFKNYVSAHNTIPLNETCRMNMTIGYENGVEVNYELRGVFVPVGG